MYEMREWEHEICWGIGLLKKGADPTYTRGTQAPLTDGVSVEDEFGFTECKTPNALAFSFI